MYTSYLYKELTGVEPPFIPHDIISRTKWYFINIYKAGERLVFEGKLSGNITTLSIPILFTRFLISFLTKMMKKKDLFYNLFIYQPKVHFQKETENGNLF